MAQINKENLKRDGSYAFDDNYTDTIVDSNNAIDTALQTALTRNSASITMSAGFSSATARTVKDNVTGLVTLIGAVITTTATTVGAQIGTINSSYRLTATRFFHRYSTNGMVTISVAPSGAIYIDTVVPNGTTIYLEGVVYSTI